MNFDQYVFVQMFVVVQESACPCVQSYVVFYHSKCRHYCQSQRLLQSQLVPEYIDYQYKLPDQFLLEDVPMSCQIQCDNQVQSHPNTFCKMLSLSKCRISPGSGSIFLML